jgi:type VI secretion system Hcp family effector
MSSTPLLGRITPRLRLLAVFVSAILVAAGILALTQQQPKPTRAPHYLGMRQLELDAFNGSAKLYLRIPPITPTASPSHATDIAVTSFGLNVDTPSAAVGAAPTVKVSDLVIKKVLDKASPKLFGAAVSGTHFKTVTLFILPAVQRDPEELVYKLTQAEVSSDHASTTGQGSAEAVSLNFTKIEVQYVRQNKVIDSATYTVPAVQ